jgi:hypothetical protein
MSLVTITDTKLLEMQRCISVVMQGCDDSNYAKNEMKVEILQINTQRYCNKHIDIIILNFY